LKQVASASRRIVSRSWSTMYDLTLVPRSLKSRCSSVVEHFLGKEEVDSSILFNGS
jgi:hypothetical protein